MQHLGAWDGAHKGPGQMSSTFVGKPEKSIEPFRGTNICMIAGENFCDVAISIMAAKIAKKAGLGAIIINQDKGWGEFISIISNKEIKVNDQRFVPDSKDGRYNLIAKDMQKMLGGSSAVINMETAADECRWMVYSCLGDVEKFIETKLTAAGIPCTKDDFDWASFQRTERIDNLTYRGFSIGNHTIVNNLESDKKIIEGEISKTEGIIKYLVKERPNDVSWKQSVYNLTPWMTVKAINSAGRFVSVMNKSSFVSLFCIVEKQIYDKADFAQVILPKVNTIPLTTQVGKKVFIWAPFKLTEEMERHFTGYPVFSVTPPVVAPDEWVIHIHQKATGFYPGWAEELIHEPCPEFAVLRDAPAAGYINGSPVVFGTRLSLRRE
jgi:hypothetical protein